MTEVFLTQISSPLAPGDLIRIQGKVPREFQRFQIDLVCKADGHQNKTPLHLSLRHSQGCIVRNHSTEKGWGPEEKGPLPIRPNDNFEILILVDVYFYKIAINGKHYCEFPYRLPYQSVNHLTVLGDVVLESVAIEPHGAGKSQFQYSGQSQPHCSLSGRYPAHN